MTVEAIPSQPSARKRVMSESQAFQVETGQVDLLFVQHIGASASSSGRGRFLGTLDRGSACFGLQDDVEGGHFEFRGRGRESTDRLLSPADLRAIGSDSFREWVMLLASAPLKGPVPRLTREVQPGIQTARPNEVLITGSEFVWVWLRNGSTYVWGRRSETATVSGGPWPIAPNTWFTIRDDALMEVVPWDEVDDHEQFAEGLRRYGTLILRLLAQDSRTRDAVEYRRLVDLDGQDRELMTRSCRTLASVLDPDGEQLHVKDPLESAASRVARHAGFAIEPGSSGVDQRPGVRLRTLARMNHFRIRRVALRGRWWTRDMAPMLGVWRDGSRLGRTVAILPVVRPWSGSTRSVLWDPVDGSERVVEEDLASQMTPFAYAFYRPVPERPTTVKVLMSHALQGCGRDVRLLITLGLVAGGLAALTPILTGKVYDVAIPEASRSQLVQIVALLLSVTVASVMLQVVRALAVLRIETRMDDGVQAGVWDHLLKLPATFFRRFTAGDLATRAGSIAQIRQLLSGAASSALLTGLFAAWYLALMFYYDVRMAGWVSLALAIVMLGSLALARIQMWHQRTATRIQSRLSGVVLQLITGLSKLRVAGAEIRAFARWAEGFSEQRRSHVRARRAGNLLVALQATAPIVLLALAYGLMFDSAEPKLSTGSLLAFQTALVSLIGAVGTVTNIFMAAASAVPLFEQLEPILKCEPEQTAARVAPGELTGDIDVRHVSFSYAPDAPLVLDDVSFHVPAGSFVALVGPSGSGKSSILRLLLGFESPLSGSIYFDGQDIAGLDPFGLRRQFGVVLQEAGIIAGDIFTNISGAADATLEDAWEAARMAGLEDDIRGMPMGMHTVIDQNGTTISGGQRQRLMIARAIVSRPRILLMDEATSALDNVTQERVARSLAALKVTRVVVAHRLTTIKDADVIYVLDRGKIVERGDFASLMDRGGLFHRLARRQMVQL